MFHSDAVVSTRTLRDYQEEAARRILVELENVQSTLCVLPTGMGKTVLLSKIASEWAFGNVLILAHRIELLEQAADKMKFDVGFRPPIEQGQRGLDADGLWQGGNIVIGSVQTLRGVRRMRKYREYPFGLVIIDEAHHATAASYRKIIDACLEFNPNCKILGVTATPNRTDNAALGMVFETVSFDMYLQEGIEKGWLCGIEQEFIQTDDIDFSGVTMTRNKFGEADFNREQLEALLTEEGPLHAMTTPILDRTGNGEQCLIFNAGVAHAHLMAAVINRYKPGSAAAVDGKTLASHRAVLVADFHRGALQYLCNYGVFTEGFDAPAISLVVMGRPTKSLTLYLQMLGRGTRPLPGVVDGPETPELRRAAILGSDKPRMTVIDFVGNSKHKPKSAVDALGGDYDADIRALAEESIREKGKGDVKEELDKAKADYELLGEEKIRKQIKAESVSYTSHKVDVFGHDAAPVDQDVSTTRGGSSEKQIGLLVGFDVPYEVAASYTKRQAGAVIDSMRKKTCTKKQKNVLRRYGIDPMPMDRASKVIDQIVKAGWPDPKTWKPTL